MSRIARTTLLILTAALMVGGRVAQLSQSHERHYFFVLSDNVITVGSEVFSPCSAKSVAQVATAGNAWCLSSGVEVEILRQWTIAIEQALTTADNEDCTLVIETSVDLSTWTEVAGSEIRVGEHAATQNPTGVCQAAILNVIGEYCSRDFNGVVPAGGGWRINFSAESGRTCSSINGAGGHVLSIIQ